MSKRKNVLAEQLAAEKQRGLAAGMTEDQFEADPTEDQKMAVFKAALKKRRGAVEKFIWLKEHPGEIWIDPSMPEPTSLLPKADHKEESESESSKNRETKEELETRKREGLIRHILRRCTRFGRLQKAAKARKESSVPFATYEVEGYLTSKTTDDLLIICKDVDDEIERLYPQPTRRQQDDFYELVQLVGADCLPEGGKQLARLAPDQRFRFSHELRATVQRYIDLLQNEKDRQSMEQANARLAELRAKAGKAPATKPATKDNGGSGQQSSKDPQRPRQAFNLLLSTIRQYEQRLRELSPGSATILEVSDEQLLASGNEQMNGYSIRLQAEIRAQERAAKAAAVSAVNPGNAEGERSMGQQNTQGGATSGAQNPQPISREEFEGLSEKINKIDALLKQTVKSGEGEQKKKSSLPELDDQARPEAVKGDSLKEPGLKHPVPVNGEQRPKKRSLHIRRVIGWSVVGVIILGLLVIAIMQVTTWLRGEAPTPTPADAQQQATPQETPDVKTVQESPAAVQDQQPEMPKSAAQLEREEIRESLRAIRKQHEEKKAKEGQPN